MAPRQTTQVLTQVILLHHTDYYMHECTFWIMGNTDGWVGGLIFQIQDFSDDREACESHLTYFSGCFFSWTLSGNVKMFIWYWDFRSLLSLRRDSTLPVGMSLQWTLTPPWFSCVTLTTHQTQTNLVTPSQCVFWKVCELVATLLLVCTRTQEDAVNKQAVKIKLPGWVHKSTYWFGYWTDVHSKWTAVFEKRRRRSGEKTSVLITRFISLLPPPQEALQCVTLERKCYFSMPATLWHAGIRSALEVLLGSVGSVRPDHTV